jgi:thiamine kinase-like enzyme
MTKERLTEILIKSYNIEPEIIDKSAWGYNTIAYYVRDVGKKQYIFKVTNYNQDNEMRAQKDIHFANYLKQWIPTTTYIKNIDGNYMLLSDNKIIKVAHYVEGTAPFDMDLEVYEQVVNYLGIIHSVPTPDLGIDVPNLPTSEGSEQKFLHGDLTASNIIVADNNIRVVLDFEDACIGPVEYDTARSAVFCWFRMTMVSFAEVYKLTIDKYEGEIKPEIFLDHAIKHAQNHLDQVIQHKNNYKDMVFWNDDYNFSKNALEEIKASAIV